MIEGGIPYTLELEMDILLLWTVCIRLGSSVLVFCANLTQTVWRAWWVPLSEDRGPCRCSGGPFRCMATRLCQHFLNKEAIDAIECPPVSVNPIERLWDVMCRCSRCRYVAPRTAEELTDALIKVWWEIPQETIAHVIGSTFRSRSEYIQAYGAHTLLSHIAGYHENIYRCWIIVYLKVHTLMWREHPELTVLRLRMYGTAFHTKQHKRKLRVPVINWPCNLS